jgi:predicted TIM-barrel fold metal-dependent hydrolase
MSHAPPIVSKPQRPLPAGACDSHAHVFGPFDRFPLIAERRYQPPLGPYEDYVAMLDRAGFAYGAPVHASANGYDNSGTLDALARAGGRLRGVAVVHPDAGREELEAMHALGMRGLRFSDTGPAPARQRAPGVLALADLPALAPRLRALGWHADLFALCRHIVAIGPQLLELGIPIVVDHMGRFDAALGVGDTVFQSFLRLVRDGEVWVKLTPLRNSTNYPDYSELRPFHDALLEAAPDRLLWGSDWPFIGMDDAPPDVGVLIDRFDAWTQDEPLRTRIFVDNPSRLYGFTP